MTTFETHKKRLFIYAALLLAAVNLLILTGVTLNRSGEPTTLMELSEREMRISDPDIHDNSARYLSIEWRTDPEYGYRTNASWLDEKRLAELGFRLRQNDEGYLDETPTRELYIVLEMDGRQYRRAIAKLENEIAEYTATQKSSYDDDYKLKALRKQLEDEQTKNSRLFAIDAGKDANALREKYPDKKRYIILSGLIEPQNMGKGKVQGRIGALHGTHIYIPLRFHEKLRVKELRGDTTPRFKATVAIGSRYEPYIVSVE